MKTQFVVKFGLQRHGQTCSHFISGDDRGHKLVDADFGMRFAQRDGCRKHHDAGMDGTGLMRVVKLQAVSCGAVR